jgi:hypothetical protein
VLRADASLLIMTLQQDGRPAERGTSDFRFKSLDFSLV